jgi:hypothetical protein
MRLSFAASVAKCQQDSRLNEDALGERASHGVYAVSGGASESFDSRRWSKLLVQLFLRNPHVDERWLRRAVTVFAGQFDRETMSWSAQAAFARHICNEPVVLADAAGLSVAVPFHHSPSYAKGSLSGDVQTIGNGTVCASEGLALHARFLAGSKRQIRSPSACSARGSKKATPVRPQTHVCLRPRWRNSRHHRSRDLGRGCGPTTPQDYRE